MEDSSTQAPDILKILGNDERWQIVKVLAVSDFSLPELSEETGIASNRIAHHLEHMRALNIISERLSSADYDAMYYGLRLEHLQTLFFNAGAALHPALAVQEMPQLEPEALPGPIRILFLCTHNSARSQMAEGLARHLGRGSVVAFSAGTEKTFVKPEAIEAMRSRGIDISHQSSDLLNDYLHDDFDYVITVCDAAKESCPVFPGGKQHIHWSFADPSAVEEPEARLAAFKDTARQLNTRIQYLLMIAQRKHGIKLASL